jgi:hypothetical protein
MLDQSVMCLSLPKFNSNNNKHSVAFSLQMDYT